MFDSEAQVTDPLAFLERLRHKSQYRAGRACALLARLSADLSDWLGWDVDGSLGRKCAFEARWQATRASLRWPVIVALDMGRHIFDASTRLDDPEPLQQPGVVLLDRPDVWCEAGRQPQFFKLLDAWFPRVQFFVALSPSGRGRFPAQLLEQCLLIPEPQPRRRPVLPRRLPQGTVQPVDVDGTAKAQTCESQLSSWQ